MCITKMIQTEDCGFVEYHTARWKKIKAEKEKINLENRDERIAFLQKLDGLLKDWMGPLPDFIEAFEMREVNFLLVEAAKDANNPRERRLMTFIADSGYRVVPDIDEDGKPVSRRDTAIHQLYERVVKHGYEDLLRILFKIYGFDVNYKDGAAVTHLQLACIAGCDEIVEKLIESGQDLNLVAENSIDPPLHLALAHNRKEVSAVLLLNGANPNLKNKNKLTPLQIICKGDRDDYELAQMLFDLSAQKDKPVEVNSRNMLGDTPLLWAVSNRRKNMFRVLLQNGADPNLQNAEGKTSMQIICQEDDAVEWLNMLFVLSDEKYHDKLCNTGCAKFFESLFRNFCWVEVYFKALQKAHTPAKVNAQDDQGNTLLHWAVQRQEFSALNMISWLLRNNADPNLVNNKGMSVLHVICRRGDGHNLMMTVLEISARVNREVKINARDRWGRTPLLLALAFGKAELVELLLRNGADQNLASKDGSTPLHVISQRRSGDGLAEMFFNVCTEERKPARIDIRNNRGWTPLEFAVSHLLLDVIDQLLYRSGKLSEFVFPNTMVFPEETHSKMQYNCIVHAKFKIACHALAAVERLENKGYKLDAFGAIAVVKFFREHKLLPKSYPNIEEYFDRDEEEFASKARGVTVIPGLSLYELLRMRPDEAEEKVAFSEYYDFACSDELWKLPEGFRVDCTWYLYERLFRELFRRTAVDLCLWTGHQPTIVGTIANRSLQTIGLKSSHYCLYLLREKSKRCYSKREDETDQRDENDLSKRRRIGERDRKSPNRLNYATDYAQKFVQNEANHMWSDEDYM